MKRYPRLRAAYRHAAMFVLLFTISAPAFCAEVSGKVTLDGQPFDGMLTLPNGVQVHIQNGEYRILIPDGAYPVVFDKDGRRFHATIESSTVPVRQDIILPTN